MIYAICALAMGAINFFVLAAGWRRAERIGWSDGYRAGLNAGADMERTAICQAVAEGTQLARIRGRDVLHGVN